MTDIKDLIIEKQEEYIKILKASLDFLADNNLIKEYEDPDIESLELETLVDVGSELFKELASLKAQIPDTTINRSYSKVCESCKGSGVISEPFPSTTSITRICPACNGSGVVIVTEILASDTDMMDKSSIIHERRKIASDTEAGKDEECVPYFGWCDVDKCDNEGCSGGMAWCETGYWTVCSKHSAESREGKPQPKMKQSAIDRERNRDPKTGYLKSKQ